MVAARLHRMLALGRSRLAPLVSPRASSVPVRWIRKTEVFDQDQICLFVTYAPGGKIPAHSLFHARAWVKAGFKLTLIVAVDEFESYAPSPDLNFADGLCLRLNQGYDFGAWA